MDNFSPGCLLTLPEACFREYGSRTNQRQAQPRTGELRTLGAAFKQYKIEIHK